MKLSIIMPCYNVDDTIKRSLDSIFMQETNFEYEVIAIDDCSTDNTVAILESYKEKYPNLIILKNEKNSGNALTFKKGAENSRGDYLCVLDGDDFYTVKYKLQKQVDFLDGDKEKVYAAVAHKYLMMDSRLQIKGDGDVFGPEFDFTFWDFINQQFYYHTSTMMYRNIFKNIDYKILEKQRGDTIRTFIAMGAINGKVKRLNFVGSVYFINSKGIWSSLDTEARNKMNIDVWKSCLRHAQSDAEKYGLKDMIERKIDMLKKPSKPVWWDINGCLGTLRKFCNDIAFMDKDFIFRKLYASRFIDSFCETLGYAALHIKGYKPIFNPDKKRIVFIISALNKRGGGVYQEILELATVHKNFKITILLTDMASIDEMPAEVKEDYLSLSNVSFNFFGNLTEGYPKLHALQHKIRRLAPAKIYYYCGHNNVVADFLIQNYGAKNIVPFSFDHGFSLGLMNSEIDTIIAKTPKDYKLLRETFGDKVIYIPCWSNPAPVNSTYIPFSDHDKLRTATAAARFYKYGGGPLGDFSGLVADILSATGGTHIHYGPLPENIFKRIVKRLVYRGISVKRFKHIPWAPDIQNSMLAEKVDLFISPFPTTSIKLSLQCMSAGIPLLAYAGGIYRIEHNDFVYPEVLRWKDKNDFVELLSKLDSETLSEKSNSGIEYFKTHNNLKTLSPYILLEKEFPEVPIPPNFADNVIINAQGVTDIIVGALPPGTIRKLPPRQIRNW